MTNSCRVGKVGASIL